MSDVRRALEAAIAENFDDLAAHAAYADLLTEQGDPRGEFIQVQLALEDPDRSPAERKRLRAREKVLFDEHGRTWLGSLAPFLFGTRRSQTWWGHEGEEPYQFRRGRLDALRLGSLQPDFARSLARAPEALFLHSLSLEHALPESLEALFDAEFLPHLRTLQIGETPDESYHQGFNCTSSCEEAHELVGRLPRIEELYLFTDGVDLQKLFALKNLNHLRMLQIYHNDEYPFGVLADNPSLGQLTHLLVHPRRVNDGPRLCDPSHLEALLNASNLPSLTHLQLRLCELGDELCEMLVESGVLPQLTWLDLQHGTITDEGAELLGGSPDAERLETINVSDNALTAEGVAALEGTGAQVIADDQHEPGDETWRFMGDIE
jgi:uncharacterized protein (TIGR02996 family)